MDMDMDTYIQSNEIEKYVTSPSLLVDQITNAWLGKCIYLGGDITLDKRTK